MLFVSKKTNAFNYYFTLKCVSHFNNFVDSSKTRYVDRNHFRVVPWLPVTQRVVMMVMMVVVMMMMVMMMMMTLMCTKYSLT